MDSKITEALQAYCDGLLGLTTNKPQIKSNEEKTAKIKKKSKKKLTLESNERIQEEGKQEAMDVEESVIKSTQKITSDGFKITNEIPPDDSDISDAFESYDEEELDLIEDKAQKNSKNKKEIKMTEDGFKIKNTIESDDSDISDAFESDEEFGVEDPENDVQNGKFNKKMQKFMSDFGITENSLIERKNNNVSSNKNKMNSQTLAAKLKGTKEINFIDYSKKRGKSKPKSPEKCSDDVENVNNVELVDENDFKRTRHEVFKFGMNGFYKDKDKFKETRMALAIRLGAKPLKNESKNYRDLQVQIKKKKEEAIKEKEIRRKQGLKVKKEIKQKKRDRNEIRGFGTQGGRFRDGNRIISKSELRALKD